MKKSSVRLATCEDRTFAIGALIRAFAKDPVMSWIAREDARYPCVLGDLFLHAFNESVAMNMVHVATINDHVAGVTCWYPPGKKFDPSILMYFDFVGWSWEKLWRAIALANAADAAHPKVPHYYLFCIGVDPLAQGTGVAGELMRVQLAKADAEGIPCYLENSNSRNTPIYEHFGFVNKGRIELGEGAPELLAMWRDVPAATAPPAPRMSS